MTNILTDFLRYHTLVRVFNGNIALWQHILRNTSRDDTEDARFLRWLQSRCAADPNILERIRETVDRSGLWPSEKKLTGGRVALGPCRSLLADAPMSEEKVIYVCPFCNAEQMVSRGLWELVFAQVLMHFSRCAPPHQYPDTSVVMEAAERIANMISQDVD